MAHNLGLDVSLQEVSICVVNEAGAALLRSTVPTALDRIAAPGS